MKGKIGKSVNKESRVEAEKARQLKVMQDKLKDRKKNKSKLKASSVEDSSDDSLDMRALRKKMSKKKKDECSKKLSSRLRQAGAYFPEDSDSTTSTGTDSSGSGKKAKSKRKVKSGARVKKRPVVKTELWPHTIANEDDGDEVSCDNIGLAKFLSCFTFIMTSCGKAEAAGRAELLHAVSSVLECLPWADARTFHNLVMVKLEQGRFDWTVDFSALAEQYLDKKARQNLRGKSSATGTSNNNN